MHTHRYTHTDMCAFHSLFLGGFSWTESLIYEGDQKILAQFVFQQQTSCFLGHKPEKRELLFAFLTLLLYNVGCTFTSCMDKLVLRKKEVNCNHTWLGCDEYIPAEFVFLHCRNKCLHQCQSQGAMCCLLPVSCIL